MAILNFPNTRQNGDPLQSGDQYTGDNGVTYIFDGVKWVGHAVAQPAGTNSITNNGHTVQINADGNLVIPNNATIVYASGDPVVTGGGSTGTSWNLTSQGNGCPIDVTLTTTTFDVQVPRNHLFFRDDGSWDIGSYVNETYITGDTSGGNGIALTTDRGTILFGNTPEVCTQLSHFHIMRDDPTTVDLFFGDDLNYVKLPYYSTLTNIAYGVEIGTNGEDGANVWRFGTDGILTLAGVPSPNFFSDLGTIKYQPSGWFPLQTVGTSTSGTVGGTGVAAAYKFNKTLYEFDFAYIRVGIDTIMLDYADVGYPDPPGTKGYPAVITVSIQDPEDPDLWIIGQNNVGVAFAEGTTVWLKYGEENIVLNETWGFGSSILSIPGNAKLINGYGKEWTFGDNGVLTLPGGTTRIGNTFGSDAILGSTDTSVAVVAQGLNGSASILWLDDTANVGSSGTHVAAVVVNSPFASSSGTVQIATGLSNGLISDTIWEFGADGTLTLPNGSTITDNIGTLSQGPIVDTQNISDNIGVFHGLDFSAPNGVAVGWTVNGPGVTNANIFGLDTVNGFVEIDSGVFQVSESYTFTGPSAGIAGVSITANSNNWTFGADGELTLSTGGHLGATKGGTMLDAGNGYSTSLTSFYPSGNYASCVTANADGTLYITTYNDGGPNPSKYWQFGADGVLNLPGTVGDIKRDGVSVLGGGNGVLVATTSTAPTATTGTQWFNTIEGRTYVALNNQWVDASPTVIPPPSTYLEDLSIDGDDLYDANGSVIRVAAEDTPPTRVNGQLWYDTLEGRAYIKYNDQWVDFSPTVIPPPSTYLGDIEIDGSTLYINNATLTVDDSGTLLVNGEQVSGSGGDSFITTGTLFGPQVVGFVPADSAFVFTSTASNNNVAELGFVAPGGIGSQNNTDFVLALGGANIGGNTATSVMIFSSPGVAGDSNYWKFDGDGVLTLSTASTILGSGTDPNVYIETSTLSTTSTWTFGTNGILTLPAATPIIKGGGTGTDVTVIATTGSNTSTWVFGANGTTHFPHYTFPAVDGAAYQMLQTDGSGNLTWVDNAHNYISNGTSGVTIPGENGNVTISVEGNTIAEFTPTGVNITGNLNITNSATYIVSTNTVYTDSLIEIHAPPGGVTSTWITNDLNDIGFRFHYYDGADKNAGLFMDNGTWRLKWVVDGVETGGQFVHSGLGDIEAGTFYSNGWALSTSTGGGSTLPAGIVFDTTQLDSTGTSTYSLFNTPATLNIYNGNTSGTVNLGSGPTASGQTVNVNLGTNGLAGSITNVNIGSQISGASSVITAYGIFRGYQVQEKFTSVTPANASTATLDCSSGNIFNITMGTLSQNWTPWLTNLNLPQNYITTISIIVNQTSTAYIPTSVTIPGATNTTFTWQGGSTPTGSANKKDVIALNIYSTQTNYYTVLAQLVSF